jgi:hypothetical protein
LAEGEGVLQYVQRISNREHEALQMVPSVCGGFGSSLWVFWQVYSRLAEICLLYLSHCHLCCFYWASSRFELCYFSLVIIFYPTSLQIVLLKPIYVLFSSSNDLIFLFLYENNQRDRVIEIYFKN